MDSSNRIPDIPLRGEALRGPLIPAGFVALGSERPRQQRSGVSVRFRSVSVHTEYRAVYSRLDGYSSDWYADGRQWVPVDALIDGQLEVVKLV